MLHLAMLPAMVAVIRALTPSVQWLVDPALKPEEDQV